MKYLLVFFIIALISCSNSDNTATSIPAIVSEEQSLKDLTKKYPDSSILAENLIQFYRDSGNYKSALSVADEKVRKDSTNARWWDIKGTLDFENGDTTAAISAFEKAVNLLPDARYIISLGTLYAQIKDANALSMADALINLKMGKEKEADFIRGLFYSYSNEKEKSIGYFDKAIQLSYTYMEAYTEKSLALYDLGKYPQALAVLDKALTLQNNYDEGYYYRGRCLEKLGRRDEAAESYQAALMYDPDYTEAKEALEKLGSK